MGDPKEEMFLAAVQEGNIATFMDLLQHKEDHDLDLEYTDSNGQTALQAAIAEGYSGMRMIEVKIRIHQMFEE